MEIQDFARGCVAEGLEKAAGAAAEELEKESGHVLKALRSVAKAATGAKNKFVKDVKGTEAAGLSNKLQDMVSAASKSGKKNISPKSTLGKHYAGIDKKFAKAKAKTLKARLMAGGAAAGTVYAAHRASS